MADKMLENNERARSEAREVYDLARKITAELHAEHHRTAVRFTLEPGEPVIHLPAWQTPEGLAFPPGYQHQTLPC